MHNHERLFYAPLYIMWADFSIKILQEHVFGVELAVWVQHYECGTLVRMKQATVL